MNPIIPNSHVLNKISKYVKITINDIHTTHDWSHVCRVHKMAKQIVSHEYGDPFIIEISALLHDFHRYKQQINIKLSDVETILKEENISRENMNHIMDIIMNTNFKGAGVPTPMKTIEGMIVQDAERLDEIGAIGIARAFHAGGLLKSEIFNPKKPPCLHETYEEYKNRQWTTINIFYEKLLLLKNRMNTDTARTIAKERHGFMENFLSNFFAEWSGKNHGSFSPKKQRDHIHTQ